MYLTTVLLLIATPLAAVVATSIAVSPEAIEQGRVALTPACPRKQAGLPCNTCGLTRSFTAIPRGRLVDAWSYNRAGLPLYGATWAALIASIAAARRVHHATQLLAHKDTSPPSEVG